LRNIKLFDKKVLYFKGLAIWLTDGLKVISGILVVPIHHYDIAKNKYRFNTIKRYQH